MSRAEAKTETSAVSSAKSDAVYIGRQPIYNCDLKVTAYELLYRDSEANFADGVDGEMMTTQVIINAFLDIGIDELVGEHIAFINIPRGYIIGEQTHSLPKDRVVLEVLEDVEVDDKVVLGVQNLVDQGYNIALDDFIYHDTVQPLVKLANIIKIDLMALDRAKLDQYVKRLKSQDVKLLAEKVETKEEFDYCKLLGFDYYQGYFFSKPQIVMGAKLAPNRVAVLQLITKLYEPEVTYGEIEKVISQDATLGYKLLRILNSAAYSLSRKIDSMQHALAILGIKNIRNWVSMIAFAGVDDKPNELFQVSMIRAKMCELLGKEVGAKEIDSYFTAGLFSNLDALMDIELSELVAPLPLSTDIKTALLGYEGRLGAVLKCVLAYEKGEWSQVKLEKLQACHVKTAYVEAVQWAREMNKEITV